MALPRTVMLLTKQLESCHWPLVTSTEASCKFSMIEKPEMNQGRIMNMMLHAFQDGYIYFKNTWNSNEPSFLGFDQIALVFLDSARTHTELLLKGSLASGNYETRG